MGLPHVVVRFYTNPDGRAARRTTLIVLALLGLFYVLPPVYAALGRVYGSALSHGGTGDTLVLELPSLMLPGLGGDLLTGLVTAGAFAAFLSTSSGLSIAVAGVLSQDVTGRLAGRLPERLRSTPDRRQVAAFRLGAVVAVIVPASAALLAPDVPVARVVGLAFAVSASTFAPLLLLGIWWRGLTPAGAIAGLLVGGVGSATSVVWTLADPAYGGWADALLGQPAAWSVPAACLTMIVVSRATSASVPPHVRRFMIRLHTPEAVELDRG
jgi:Na+(H+)/acetate symporter ActP